MFGVQVFDREFSADGHSFNDDNDGDSLTAHCSRIKPVCSIGDGLDVQSLFPSLRTWISRPCAE
jgi:hypothetical protein